MGLTGENFKRAYYKTEPAIKVSKQDEKRIRHEIKLLQDQSTKNHENDALSWEEVVELEKPITVKIHKLIDSMY